MYAWKKLSGFCDTFGLKSLIKDATWYKNPENPNSIDLILTKNPRSFQNFCLIETGLSDFHRMVLTVMKTSFDRLKPRVINYRDYKSFENKLFREDLLYELSKNFRGECRWFSRVFRNMSKNSKSPFPNQTNVCTGQSFAIYKQNPFRRNNNAYD